VEIHFPETPAIKFLKERYREDGLFRVERIKGELMPPNMWLPYGFYSLAGYDLVYPVKYADFLKIQGLVSQPSRYVEWDRDYPLFDKMKVRYLMVLKRDKLGGVDQNGELPSWLNRKKWRTVFKGGR